MPNNIKAIVAQRDNTKFATNTGTNMHNRLRAITIDDNQTRGDTDLIAQIKSVPNLAQLFCSLSKTEIPIAGNIGTHFISRRIDRLYTDESAKTIYVLDYKTDTNRTANRNQYIKQLCEYSMLLADIYPDYQIKRLILWTHDWILEDV